VSSARHLPAEDACRRAGCRPADRSADRPCRRQRVTCAPRCRGPDELAPASWPRCGRLGSVARFRRRAV